MTFWNIDKKNQLLGWLPNIRNIFLVFKFPATLLQFFYSFKITLNLKLKALKIKTYDNISLKVLLNLKKMFYFDDDK